MITLAIDASTYAGDVAVLDGVNVLAEESVEMKGADRERLMPAVASVLNRAGVETQDIQRVVCGAGPGSFTSLRIAGAIAKGMANGVGCPLFAVPSMALILGGTNLSRGRYLVAVNALRGEYYVGLYVIQSDGSIAELERARLVGAADIVGLATEHNVMIVCSSPFPDAVTATPRSSAVSRMERILQEHGPVALDGWEPAYGRLAEAQVRWECAHGRPLPVR